MKTYKVLVDFGDLKVDEIVEGAMFDEATLSELISNGTLEEVLESEPVEPKVETDGEPEDAVESEVSEPSAKVYTFSGKDILSFSTREVEGKQVRHLTMTDGSQMDILESEYNAIMEQA
jgi:hypothetical protein